MSKHDDRICKHQPRHDKISLTCVNHPDRRWGTKNIGHVGARSIFYNGSVESEVSWVVQARATNPIMGALNNRHLIGNKAGPIYEDPEDMEVYTEQDWLSDMREAISEFERMILKGIRVECPCPIYDLVVACPECEKESEDTKEDACTST